VITSSKIAIVTHFIKNYLRDFIATKPFKYVLPSKYAIVAEIAIAT
jgi:hypothetical protein